MQVTRPVYYTVLVTEQGDTLSLNRQIPHVILITNRWKQEPRMSGALALLISDAGYQRNLDSLQSDPTGTDFTGVVIYSYLNGIPVYGRRYENGQAVRLLLFDPDTEYETDPSMGIALGAGCEDALSTRGIHDNNVIDPVTVTAPKPNSEDTFFISAPPTQEDGTSGGHLGGGTSPKPPKPQKEPTDPCKNMKNKMDHPEFAKMLNELAGLTSSNYEAGRAYQYNYHTPGYTFTTIDGNPGEPWIDFNPLRGSNLSGFVHTHFDGLLPIFSPEDLLIPGAWDKAGALYDLERFTLGVATSSGTYFIQVTDLNAYKKFFEKYSNEEGLESLNDIYEANMDILSGSVEDKLAALLYILKPGLTLMVKSGDKFTKVYRDELSGGIIKKPC